MFNQVLRKRGTHKLIYSTSIGFRIIFLVTAAVVIGSIAGYGEGSLFLRWMARRKAMLSVVDRDGHVYGLDMVRGGSVREARKSAELLSDFYGIPLEDHLGDLSDGMQR